MMDFLTTYWLEALLAAGFVLLLALPFVWLRGKIEEYADVATQVRDILSQEMRIIKSDLRDLNEKFKALDKPSNDKALFELAKKLNAKIILQKKISRKPIATSKPRRKANGVGSHVG